MSPTNYPSLRALLAQSANDLGQYRQAVNELICFAYGDRHSYLTPAQRNERLHLYRLGNLLERLSLLDDAPIMEWGHRCPDQLRRYDAVLRTSIKSAYDTGLRSPWLQLLDDLHERIWQVLQMVTWQSEALS